MTPAAPPAAPARLLRTRWPRPLLLLGVILALTTAGCGDDSAEHGGGPDGQAADRGFFDAQPPLPDAGPLADASADTGPIEECTADIDCGEAAWCDQGACQMAPEGPVFDLPMDGVTRAAAAGFDLTPDYLERWTEVAGPGCPENRPGRFDGQLDRPLPLDPCLDTFEDTNDNGRFDALWRGGSPDRPAGGVDAENPAEGRVLLLARDAELLVVVTLDVQALGPAYAERLTERLRLRLGVPAHQITLHTTGNRAGPDAVGLGGPSYRVVESAWAEALQAADEAGALDLLGGLPLQSGVDPHWWQEVERRCEAAVAEAGRRLAPVTLRQATVALPMAPDPEVDGPFVLSEAAGRPMPPPEMGPLSPELNDADDRAAWAERPQWLARDTHLPPRRDHTLRVMALDPPEGEAPVAVVASWGAASALPDAEWRLSAGFPGHVRTALEAHWPGTHALWLTGPGADTVVVDGRVLIPSVDAEGRAIDEAGALVEALDEAALAAPEIAADALGRWLARLAQEALEGTEPTPADLERRSRFVWLPVSNPRVGLAARLGLLSALGHWLTGRDTTSAWSSGADTPACGALGCLRHRMDLVRLGALSLLTTPGAFDAAYALGRGEGSIAFGDALELQDLDADGVTDLLDAEIRPEATVGGAHATLDLPGPANPLLLTPIEGLEREGLWIIARTGGGLGSLRPALEVPGVFEGQLEALWAYTRDEALAALDLCAAGYPCPGGLTLGGLVDRALADQPDLLADIAGAHTLWLTESLPTPPRGPQVFRIIRAEALLFEGEDLIFTSESRVFSLSSHFAELGIARGDRLVLPHLEQALEIGGLVDLELARHPDASDAWLSASPGFGDLVYNTACELIFEGACPHRRPLPQGEDPNQTLPRGY